jgi:hypothetical protein
VCLIAKELLELVPASRESAITLPQTCRKTILAKWLFWHSLEVSAKNIAS